MKAKTDYPLNGQAYDGVWNEVELLAYDRYKYVMVRGGTWVKNGYIKRLDGKPLSMAQLYSLPEEVEDKKPTRRDVAAELKAWQKYKQKVWYRIYLEDMGPAKNFSNLRSAMLHCLRLDGVAYCLSSVGYKGSGPLMFTRRATDFALEYYSDKHMGMWLKRKHFTRYLAKHDLSWRKCAPRKDWM